MTHRFLGFKIIDLETIYDPTKIEDLICDEYHQTLQGNVKYKKLSTKKQESKQLNKGANTGSIEQNYNRNITL